MAVTRIPRAAPREPAVAAPGLAPARCRTLQDRGTNVGRLYSRRQAAL